MGMPIILLVVTNISTWYNIFMKISSETELIELGRQVAGKLKGGEVIELVGDVGAGKTTFTKGLALGLGIKENVSSPSFVIMKSYPADNGLVLNHYDFYRLEDGGIMKSEIAENINNPKSITVIEWAENVIGVLPKKRQIIEIKYSPDSDSREVIL